ncbi:MAG: hypothetical protein GKR89_37675 [Candidatus Latescibacteria bacterium]|nr:hypothetical protein [Candidatus Latescibacterota bacterium]
MGAAIQLLLGLLLVAQCSGQSVQLMQLRKHYNGVAAQIDSLARQLEGVPLEALMRGASEQAQMIPAGMRLVLLFWADDEAEVFLNGFRIGQSRLTPVRVEIPPLYLQGQNQLRVHCWDTDRVESGFMAGLYLEEPNGALRPVLVTDEATWRSAGTPVQEIYYIHAVPDIPGAQVVWSDRLFGQIWLEADFDASSLQQAAGRAPAGLGDATAQARAMDTHSIVQQLVELQEELGQVEEQLAQQRRQWPQEVVYRGYVDNQVAYTLGREAPLEAVEQLQAARELHAWAAQLPQARQALVFSARRALKGSSAATLAKDRNETGSGPADRRNQYTAPQERGPAPGQAQGGSAGTGGGGSGQQVWVVAAGARDWGLWALIGGLVIYLVAAIWQNWRLYNGKVWT